MAYDEGPNYILANGETNLVPAAKWAFGASIPRFVRVNEDPVPYSGFWNGYPTCDGKEKSCDWWREKYHRKAAWGATHISTMLIAAQKQIPSVADYDAPNKISLMTYMGEYIVPLCAAINTLGELISTDHFRNRFSAHHSAAQCGDIGRCDDGWYPVQYWQDIDLAACVQLQDILNQLDDHMIDLKIKKGSKKTAQQLWASIQGAKQKQDLYQGSYKAWKEAYQKGGGAVNWTATEKPANFSGYDSDGNTEAEAGLLDKLLEQELLNPRSQEQANLTPILLGGGALLAVLLITKKKKG